MTGARKFYTGLESIVDQESHNGHTQFEYFEADE